MEERHDTRFRVWIGALAIITMLAMLLAGWAFLTRFDQTNKLRSDQDHAWHGVICTIERASIKNPNTTVQEKLQDLKFFDGLLTTDVRTTPCGLKHLVEPTG
jgi:DNA-binding transcriptional regulator of glucitol operon